MRRGFAPGFLNYKKGALDSQSQVIKFTSCLPRVGGFSPGTPASSNTTTGRHNIAEILLKVALNTKIQIHYFNSFGFHGHTQTGILILLLIIGISIYSGIVLFKH